MYHIAGNFGEVLNLAILREVREITKFKTANIIPYTITLCGSAHNHEIKNSPMYSND